MNLFEPFALGGGGDAKALLLCLRTVVPNESNIYISDTSGGKYPTRFQHEHLIRAVVYILYFPVAENAEEPQFEMDI